MADLSITAGNVVSSGVTEDHVAGAPITAGQVVYLEAATNTVKLADADHATTEIHTAKGIALNGASAGQPVKVHISGNINVGATLQVGRVYVLSNTPGGIAPAADLTTTWFPNVLGVATSASNLKTPMGGPVVGTAAWV